MANADSDAFIAARTYETQRGLSREEVKVLGLSGVGGMIELYEFIIFVLLTPYISQAFFPADSPEWLRTLQTLAIFALGYLVRPIGGIVIAILGDIFGRKRMFALTIFLMAVPTLLIGLLPTYSQVGVIAPILLLLCRLAQGLALGGEVPAAAVFVAEHAPLRRLGFACSVVGAALAMGIFLGSLTVSFLTYTLGAEGVASYGWRIAFVLGGVCGLLAGFLRRYVHETPVFKSMQEQRKLAPRISLIKLLRDWPIQLLSGVAISFMAAALTPIMLLYPPIYMRTVLRFDPALVQNALTTGTLAMAIGSLSGGWLMDKIGPLRTYFFYGAGVIVSSYLLFSGIQSGPRNLNYIYLLVGFFAGIGGLGYYFLVQAFIPQVRFTGVSLPYNISNAIGGAMPLLIAVVIARDPLAPSYIVIGLTVLALIAVPIIWSRRLPIGLIG